MFSEKPSGSACTVCPLVCPLPLPLSKNCKLSTVTIILLWLCPFFSHLCCSNRPATDTRLPFFKKLASFSAFHFWQLTKCTSSFLYPFTAVSYTHLRAH